LTDLFDHAHEADPRGAPLSDRMRPQRLDEVLGQEHLLGTNTLLGRAIRGGWVPSMILWGPPGTGKTTLARALAGETEATFVPFSAVLGGVPELRKRLAEAQERRRVRDRATILFVDEIHRFNKAQQDALLPHVEAGTVTLVGATTENPSFAVNGALLSRARVFRLEPLGPEAMKELLERALATPRRGLGELSLEVEEGALDRLAAGARGDARRALDVLELAARGAEGTLLTVADVDQALATPTLAHGSEEHYDLASALIKSMRGSDPDAAVYYMMRMIEGGEDPKFILRRFVIFASEDVGNADPRALSLAVAADQAFARLGMPEGLHPMAQCCTYLASTVKSNASYVAFQEARHDVRDRGPLPVPMRLRNAPTEAMKEWGYGDGYRYPHDEGGYAQGETYLPEALAGRRYYRPGEHGFEQRLAERLRKLRGG
jgi:putative ATPase